jgi:hypothetical protein
MYAIEPPRTASGERSLLTRSQFDALRAGTSVFTDADAEAGMIARRLVRFQQGQQRFNAPAW